MDGTYLPTGPVLVAAQLPSGTPGLFIVEPGTAGMTVEPDPGIGVRAAATARLTMHEVEVPQAALLGEGSPEAYRDCVALSRLAWCALAIGTGQAALDYAAGARSSLGSHAHREELEALTYAVVDRAG